MRRTPKQTIKFTVNYFQEGDTWCAVCPEIGVASQGDTIEEAARNWREAIDLWLQCASQEEILERLGPYMQPPKTTVFTSTVEVSYGQVASPVGS